METLATPHPNQPSSSPLRALALAAAFVALPLAAQAQFVPREVDICPGSAQVVDPEFDAQSQRMTWFDDQNRLKVAQIAPDGTVQSARCAGTVIDTGTTLSVPNFPLKNGPEFGRSRRGLEIYYTKLDSSGQPALARAWFSTTWRTELLPQGDNRGVPLPSVDAADTAPRLLYVRNNGSGYEHLWRRADSAATEAPVLARVNPTTGSSPRWIPGARAIATSAPDAAGVLQAARYDVDTQQLELLSTDAGDKSEVWMWQAPEFNNEWVFIALVNGSLRVYRKIDGSWTVIQSYTPAAFSRRPAIFTPEIVVHQGRSWIAMQLSAKRYSPSEIWMASIDPAQPLLLQLSDPAQGSLVRTEPEWLATPAGLFVYYTHVQSNGAFALRRLSTPF